MAPPAAPATMTHRATVHWAARSGKGMRNGEKIYKEPAEHGSERETMSAALTSVAPPWANRA